MQDSQQNLVGDRSCALRFWKKVGQLELFGVREELFLGGPGGFVCTLGTELLVVVHLHVHSGATGEASRSLP